MKFVKVVTVASLLGAITVITGLVVRYCLNSFMKPFLLHLPSPRDIFIKHLGEKLKIREN